MLQKRATARDCLKIAARYLVCNRPTFKIKVICSRLSIFFWETFLQTAVECRGVSKI